VEDPEGKSPSGLAFDFGLLQRKNKCEILGNILNCPPAECLDRPHDVPPLAEINVWDLPLVITDDDIVEQWRLLIYTVELYKSLEQ